MAGGNLPYPPVASQLDLKWLLENRAALIAYFEAVRALANLQMVVKQGQVEMPPVGVQLARDGGLLVLNVPAPPRLPAAIADASATTASLTSALNALLAGLRASGYLPH